MKGGLVPLQSCLDLKLILTSCILPDKFFLVSVMPWQPEMERDEVGASTNDLASRLGIQDLDNIPEYI